MNTKFKKGILNAFIFIFFVSLTFYIVLKDNSIIEILQIVKQVDKNLFCWLYFACFGLCYQRELILRGH